MRRLVKVVVYKEQYRITIPKELSEAKKWKAGTRLRFVELQDGSILLKEIKEIEGASGRVSDRVSGRGRAKYARKK